MEEVHEVETTEVKRGKLVYGPKARKLETPSTLASWMDWIRNSCAGLTGLVAATDVFTGHQIKITVFCLSAVYFLAGGTKSGVGVKPAKEEK